MRKPRLDTVLLIFWGLLLSAGVTVYLGYLQPARLGRTVSDTLESILGVRCSIRQVDFSLLPRAEVIIRDVRLAPGSVPGINIRADACRAELSWLSLLRLRPVLRSVDLEGAVADIVWPLPDSAASPDRTRAGLTEADRPWSLPVLPPLLTGVRVRVANSSLRVSSEDSSREVLFSGISGRARLPGLFRGSVGLSVGTTSFRGTAAPEITLGNLKLEAHSLREDERGELLGSLTLSTDAQMSALDSVLGHTIEPAYRYFPMPAPARVEFDANMTLVPETRQATLTGQLKLDAVLPMNGHDTPLRVTLPYRLDSPDLIRVEGLDIDFGGDRGVLTGDIRGLREGLPVFAGQGAIGHFSLIRWFGFGRTMTAGLQHALNDISGTLDFVLTPRGVRVPRLEARLQNVDAVLVGSGGCEKFHEPDIVIDGHIASAVDLNPLFPELNGVTPDPPDLPPPAVPTDDTDGPSIVGYAIHLTADKAALWKLEAAQVDCLISPAPLTDQEREQEAKEREAAIQAGESPPPPWKSAGHGPQLTIALGGLYGGTAGAVVNLDDVCRVRADLAGVSVQEPVIRMAGGAIQNAPLTGTLNAKTRFNFSGSSAAAVLGSLRGGLDATLNGGFMAAASGTRLPYRTLKVKAHAKAAPGKKDSDGVMPFSGEWQVALDTDAWTLSANSSATMTFSMANGLPRSMTPQPASLRLRLDKQGAGGGAWPGDVNLTLEGRLSFDLNEETLALTDMSGALSAPNLKDLPDGPDGPDRTDVLTLGGSIRSSGLFGSPVTEGRVSLHSSTLREAAAAFGLSLPATADPAAFSTLSLETDVRHSSRSLDLKNMNGRLDTSSVAGNISTVFGQRPFWFASLHLGQLDTGMYRPAPTASSQSPTPVQTEFLRGFDAYVRLNVDQWTVLSTPIIHFTLPLTLRKGILDSGVFTGSFPGGGTLNGTVHGDARAGQGSDQLGLRLQLRLNEVDMLPLTKSRNQDTLLAGIGTAQCDVQAAVRTWDDIPGRLDGNLSFEVHDGYLINAQTAASEEAREKEARDKRHSPDFGLNGTPAEEVQPNRTPFQILSASASITNGVLKSSDFRLESPGLSVTGDGSLNLNNKSIDARATAQLLGIPEVPVEISGSLDNPETSYKVAGALVGTIGNIGGAVVNIVSGVLTAPFRLLMGKKNTQ